MVEKYTIYSRIFFVTLILMVSFGFISQELIPSLAKFYVMFFVIVDVVLLTMALFTLRNRTDKIILLSFAIIAIFSSVIINHEGIVVIVNGSRSYFGLLFAIPIMRYFMEGKNGARFMRSFDRFLYWFLWIQAFCILWQFLKYGAGDRVGGSFGNFYSGVVSMLIYLTSFYLVIKRWDPNHYILSLKRNYIYILLLLPTFLNETKSSFIFLFLYFILLMRIDRKIIIRIALLTPLLTALFMGLGYIYLNVTNQKADTVLSKDFFEKYLVAEDMDTDKLVEIMLNVYDNDMITENGGDVDVPRFTKIILLPEIFRDSNKSLWIGAGLGQFKGDNALGLTPFAKRNKWMLRGSKPWLFFILVEIGIIGAIWMLCRFYTILNQKNSLGYSINVKLYVAAMLLFIFLYNDSLRTFSFCAMVLYTVLRCTYILPEETETDKYAEITPSPEDATQSASAI